MTQQTLTVTMAPPAAASRARMNRRVVAFGASLAFLSFVDRAAISYAAPWITREMGLSAFEMGLVFSAFGLTYALGEIPSGRLCDRLGARRLLTRVVIGWSIFTAATGAAWDFASLLTARLLFGAGESGCFPGLARVFRTWLSPTERNAAEGIKAASARWGAAMTPAMMAALLAVFTWRQVFYLFGIVGIVWAVAFHRWYRDQPNGTPALAYERRVSWSKLLRSRSVWALGIQWFCHFYGFYFYITWLPTYLLQARGLNIRIGAAAAGIPLVAAGLGSLLAGWSLTVLATRWNDPARARRVLSYGSYYGAAALLLLFTQIQDATWAMVVLSLSSFAAEFSGPASWTTAMDIGGEHVGTVSGFMNMLGHLGGSVAPAVTGALLSVSGNAWNLAFYSSALIYAAGGLCWIFIDSTPQNFEPE